MRQCNNKKSVSKALSTYEKKEFENVLCQGSMLLIFFFGKFYAGVKKLVRFENNKKIYE